VLQKVGRRALDLVIGLFAMLGFFYVPLGPRTGFEHVKAIVATPPAREAYRGFVSAADQLHRTLLDKLRGHGRQAHSRTEEPKARAAELSHVMPADAGCDASVVEPGS
jgi:hypothetical protein